MTFAAIDNATLTEWHARAIAARTMLSSHRVTPAAPSSTNPATPAVPLTRTEADGLAAWIKSLEAEMTARGLAVPGKAPASAA